MFSLAALALLSPAVAAPHLVVHHEDAYYVTVSPPAGAAEELLASATPIGEHIDEYDHMQLRQLSATSVWPLRVGDELRSWQAGDRFVGCTVQRFVAEVPGGAAAEQLPPFTVERTAFFAELSCEAEVAEMSWVVPPSDPVPYLPAARPADDSDRAKVAAVLAASPDYAEAVGGFWALVEPLEVTHEREVERVDTRAGHLLVETGRLYTGQGSVSCGEADQVLPYAAVILDGPEPEVLAFRVFAEDESPAGVVDIDRDGATEWLVYDRLSDSLRIERGDEVVGAGAYVWWSYCGC